MNIPEKPKQQIAFDSLTPDRIITLVEKALDRRCTNLFRPLISSINRVYELEAEQTVEERIGGWLNILTFRDFFSVNPIYERYVRDMPLRGIPARLVMDRDNSKNVRSL